MIRKAPLRISFAGGVDTKTDDKTVASTQLLRLENATFIKQTTLSKRNGYAALSRTVEQTEVDYPAPDGIAVARSSELHLFAGGRGYSYRESNEKWAEADEVSSVVATDDPLARSGTAQTQPDHATLANVRVAAWEDSRGGLWGAIQEAESGRLLWTGQLDANGSRPRCVPCANVLHVYWMNVPSQRIYVAVVNPLQPASSPTPIILTEDIDLANPVYDACPTSQGDGRTPAITWSTPGGFRLGYVDETGVLGSALLGLPPVATYTAVVGSGISVSFDWSADRIAVVFVDTFDSNDVQAYITDFDDLSAASVYSADETFAAVVPSRVVCEWDSSQTVWWAYEHCTAADIAANATDKHAVRAGAIVFDGTIAQTAREVRGHCLLARAIRDADNVYLPVVHAVKFFPYVSVVKMNADFFGDRTFSAARVLAGQSTGMLTHNHVASSHSVNPTDGLSRVHALCLEYRIQLSSENGDQFSEEGIRLISLDFDNFAAYQSASLGRGLYLAGAQLSHYDGDRWAESDFHCAPDTASGSIPATPSAGTGALTNSLTYGYKAVYEEVDAQGEVHNGPVSVLVDVELGASDNTVTLTIPTYRLTSKRRVRIGVFRSAGNATGLPEDIEYFRVTSLDPTRATGPNRFLENDTTVDAVTFVDTISDADLATKEPLYTNGGILSNDPTAIGGGALAGGKSRLFWVDPADRSLVRFSQTIGDELAMEQSPRLSIRMDPYGGDVVALSTMDDAVYPFTRTAVYVFGGPGPAAAPSLSQDAFSPAALVTSDVGCKSPASICQSPVGIVFQSDKGIMLLGRDRQVTDIGGPVYAYNDQTITRATLLPDRHQVVFLTDEGMTLLWDYERGQWSTYTNHNGYDAVVLDGAYHYLRTDGRVFVETPGLYADDNRQITMKIETAWLKFGEYLQGWQKVIEVLFLGSYKSAHDLRVRYRIDYNAGYFGPYDLDVNANYNPSLYGEGAYGDGLYGGSNGDTARYQRRIHLNKRCQAISFLIEDVEATGAFGASYDLAELLLLGGGIGPAFKVGNARSST